MTKTLSLLILLFFTSMDVFSQNPVLSPDDGFIIIAHRGASAYTPENTLIAFEKAIELKADMAELDVSISKDGVPVVIHDETIDRTTSGMGAVSSYTLSELKTYEYGSWFSKEFEGEPIPTLEESLRLMKGRILVNIEIKSEAVTDTIEGGIVQKSLGIVKDLGMMEDVIFSSFDYRVLEHLEDLAPGVPKALLYNKSLSSGMLPSELVDRYHADAFNCSYRELNSTWLADLKSNHIPFLIYTVNDADKMKELITAGASGIFSDKPDVLFEVVENL